jgi:hypothetical protein
MCYVVVCNKRHYIYKVYNMLGIVIGIEIAAFSIMFIGQEVLQLKEETCEDSGTNTGAFLLRCLFLGGGSFAFLGLIFLSWGIFFAMKYLYRRICCCCKGGGTVLIGYSLANIPFVKRNFKDSPVDCAICLADFAFGVKVSPLYCDVRHLFHTDCIRQWLTRNPICPLCKAVINPLKLKLHNKKVRRQFMKKGLKDADEEDPSRDETVTGVTITEASVVEVSVA